MIELARGAMVLFAERGDYTSKPRPGVIVQRDVTLSDAPSITLCGVTTHAIGANAARIALVPSAENGLLKPAYIMIDKVASIRRYRIRERVGMLHIEDMRQIDIALRRWLDL